MNKVKNFSFIIITVVMMFSSFTIFAQSNNVRITISGIEGFNGWFGSVILSTSNDFNDGIAYVAMSNISNPWEIRPITAGSSTFALEDRNGFFSRAGQYYVFLAFQQDEQLIRLFVSFNQISITGGPQHITFNYDVFYEIDYVLNIINYD